MCCKEIFCLGFLILTVLIVVLAYNNYGYQKFRGEDGIMITVNKSTLVPFAVKEIKPRLISIHTKWPKLNRTNQTHTITSHTQKHFSWGMATLRGGNV